MFNSVIHACMQRHPPLTTRTSTVAATFSDHTQTSHNSTRNIDENACKHWRGVEETGTVVKDTMRCSVQ